jgi:pimeloyl-ACP methyl ester carboxylesterase
LQTFLKIVQWSLVVALAFASIGALYQWHSSRADRARFPAPGEIHRVGGLDIHIDCRGQGSPTVVLEDGLTMGSVGWGLVHDALAETTRVCAYDRPGLDWSEPSPDALDAPSVAQRLHALLAAAGVEGPVVLVGMSAGGVFVREYQRLFPQEVVGMVFVDSSHEQQGTRLPALEPGFDVVQLLRLCDALSQVGLLRAFGAATPILDGMDVPEALRPVAEAHLYQTHSCAAVQREWQGFEAETRDVEPPASLGDLPLLVLSQGKPFEASGPIGPEEAEEMRVVWDELQEELRALSSRGERRIAKESGHMIQLEQPQIVIEGVRDVVARVRQDR